MKWVAVLCAGVSSFCSTAEASSTQSLTGRMALYNAWLGAPWTCTGTFRSDGKPAVAITSTVSMSVVPQNVILIEVSSAGFAGRSFIGFDARSSSYWRTEMGVFGGIMRQNSGDGIHFSGKSTMGGEWGPATSVLTAVAADGSTSDMEDIANNGVQTVTVSRCTR